MSVLITGMLIGASLMVIGGIYAMGTSDGTDEGKGFVFTAILLIVGWLVFGLSATAMFLTWLLEYWGVITP